jgi:beta-N-acetylhexosaminidase
MDSHEALPVVDASRDELALDFAPFRELATDDLWAMTAHILYPALDPNRCATLSPAIIDGVIRGEIGFGGFLVSDDLGMKALKGDFGHLTQAVMAAGCDAALHCSGVLAETAAVLEACPELTDKALDRLSASRARVLA